MESHPEGKNGSSCGISGDQRDYGRQPGGDHQSRTHTIERSEHVKEVISASGISVPEWKSP
jgi:hypothetical protein